MSKKLLTTVQLGDLTLKNRIALAPMTRARSGADQVPKPWNVEYYVQRASAGLIITEGTIPCEQGMGWNYVPGIYTDAHVEGWKKVTDAVHEKGGVIFCQLWHMGRVTHSTFHGKQPVAPSAVTARGDGTYGSDFVKHPYEEPHALTLEELPQVLAEYKNAAECAKRAGFDGVEIHSANGYLLDEFLQSHTNIRTDEYGGSKENRFRFVKEVIETVTSVFPSNRVGIRFSPNGAFNDMGNEDNFEVYSYYISQLNQFNLAYLHVMDGLAFGFHNKCAAMTLADVRKIYSGTVIGNCGYTPESAEAAIVDGGADLIAIGRPYISNPDLPERIANDWPLNEVSNPGTWYSPSPDPSWDPRVGYTDFSPYAPA